MCKWKQAISDSESKRKTGTPCIWRRPSPSSQRSLQYKTPKKPAEERKARPALGNGRGSHELYVFHFL